LELPSMAIVPEVSAVIDVLSSTPHCQVARMSGSGATCFGIFTSIAEANTAAESIQYAHPNWWVVATKLI